MKFKNKYYKWIVEILLVIIVLTAVRFWMQRGIVTGTAPNITATMLDGQYYDLYKDKRRPILVHFWASWCPVCKLEQSSIESIANDHPVITIAMQSGSDSEVNTFLLEQQLSFPVINDEYGSISRVYRIKGVPASFIINKKNEIKFIEVGYTTEVGLRFRMWWAGL